MHFRSSLQFVVVAAVFIQFFSLPVAAQDNTTITLSTSAQDNTTTTLPTSTQDDTTTASPVPDITTESIRERRYTLELSNADVAPDGFNRPAVVVNKKWRGPLLIANKGDTLSIDVQNRLTDISLHADTSIHWHGLFQHKTPWEDGPAGITQCPIQPNTNYNYHFELQEEAGTFWYHAHLGIQYCDGLRGPIVVYDPRDPHRSLYDEDNENTVITLEDWHHLPAGQILPPHAPASTLINGIGRYVGGEAIPLSVVNVRRGRKYRFRLVSMACGANYLFAIQGHDLQVIEADGQSVRPVTVGSLQIFPAQRYSFVLHANQPVGNYWIRSSPTPAIANAQGAFAGGINSGILRYQGAGNAEPSPTEFLLDFIQNNLKLLSERDLHPLRNPAAPGRKDINGADVSYVLPIDFNTGTGKFTVNGTTFVMPDQPVLLQIFNGRDPNDLLPEGSVIPLPPNKVIQIALPILPIAGFSGPHPFHLHGHAFSVIRGAGTTDYNYDDPVRRDVVSTGIAGDNVTIRFVTDNPGPWFLHCHIEWHLEDGLAVVLAEDTRGIQQLRPPQQWRNLCPRSLTEL